MFKKLPYFFFLAGVLLNAQVFAQPELDTTFASSGKFVIEGGLQGGTADMVVQPDKKTVYLGSCYNFNSGWSSPFCLTRLNEDGSLDNTFGVSVIGTVGSIITTIPGMNFNRAGGSGGLTLLISGKLIAVGFATFSNEERVVMVRYNPNGTIDESFGTNGFVINAINSKSRAYDVLVQPDGKILVVGYSYLPSNNFSQFVARYNSDGTLDSSFGKAGIAFISIPENKSSGFSIALQNDGKILTGGMSATASHISSYLLTRLSSDGSIDTSFANAGFKTIPYGDSFYNDKGLKLALQSDGRILALGDQNNLYRFNSNGSLDNSFDNDGSRQALPDPSDAYDLIVTPSGKITVIGHTTVPEISFRPIKYHLARYLPDGSLDNNFSEDGFLDIDVAGGDSMKDGATAAALDPNGKLVLGGRSAMGTIASPWEGAKFSTARLIASPIQNVGFEGRITNENGRPIANAVLTLRDGIQTIASGRTNPFGYFRFQNVQSSATYSLAARAKGWVFNDLRVLVDDEISNFVIVGKRR